MDKEHLERAIAHTQSLIKKAEKDGKKSKANKLSLILTHQRQQLNEFLANGGYDNA